MKQRFLFLCGMLAPVLFVFMAILGGALRPGYSHISETVSELMSPGSPNKPLLDIFHTIFALLLICFGTGIRQFVRRRTPSSQTAITAAWLYTAMGLVSVTTATIFPQDAWGSPPTYPGKMHIFMSGVVSILTILAMLLIGIWFYREEISPRFGTYSFVTIVVAVISAGFFAANMGSPIMGLAERIAILAGFQWTFALALWMFSRSGKNSLTQPVK
jgi:hypothetical protein